MGKLKVMTVLGTRPEIIRLSLGFFHHREKLLLRFGNVRQDQFSITSAFVVFACECKCGGEDQRDQRKSSREFIAAEAVEQTTDN